MIYIGELSPFIALLSLIIVLIIFKKSKKNQDKFNDLYQKYNTWDGQNEISENKKEDFQDSSF